MKKVFVVIVIISVALLVMLYFYASKPLVALPAQGGIERGPGLEVRPPSATSKSINAPNENEYARKKVGLEVERAHVNNKIVFVDAHSNVQLKGVSLRVMTREHPFLLVYNSEKNGEFDVGTISAPFESVVAVKEGYEFKVIPRSKLVVASEIKMEQASCFYVTVKGVDARLQSGDSIEAYINYHGSSLRLETNVYNISGWGKAIPLASGINGPFHRSIRDDCVFNVFLKSSSLDSRKHLNGFEVQFAQSHVVIDLSPFSFSITPFSLEAAIHFGDNIDLFGPFSLILYDNSGRSVIAVARSTRDYGEKSILVKVDTPVGGLAIPCLAFSSGSGFEIGFAGINLTESTRVDLKVPIAGSLRVEVNAFFGFDWAGQGIYVEIRNCQLNLKKVFMELLDKEKKIIEVNFVPPGHYLVEAGYARAAFNGRVSSKIVSAPRFVEVRGSELVGIQLELVEAVQVDFEFDQPAIQGGELQLFLHNALMRHLFVSAKTSRFSASLPPGEYLVAGVIDKNKIRKSFAAVSTKEVSTIYLKR